MKAIAMYLPQFHTIPENDEWWGKGYTEWTAVRGAMPLNSNHYQPRIPLKKNYYDLLDKTTMEWQVELMKEYGIYGMCFYHYYFENGKMVLEKPSENLLKWKDVKMPFCFSWANETWARTWSNISRKNSWNSKLEKKENVENGILLKQDYGQEKQWKAHFDYLLPFFKDERYIKIDNKPVFLIHNPAHFLKFVEMKEKWNAWGDEKGIGEFYFIGVNSNDSNFDGHLQQEPNYSDLFMKNREKSYEELSGQIIANAYMADSNSFLCVSPGYDDTPRRGTEGEIVYGSTPELFYAQLRALQYFAIKRNQDYLFINAWNEWGEGMYVEPDEKFKYGYLEAIKDALSNIDYLPEEINKINRIAQEGVVHQNKLQKEKYIKMRSIYEVIEKLLYSIERGKSIKAYLANKGFSSVAVCGLGLIGNHLINILSKEQIAVNYGIDQSVIGVQYEFPVFRMNDNLPKTDIIIMTYKDEAVYSKLKLANECAVITIWDLLEDFELEL